MKRLLILLAAMAIVLPACTNDDNTETTPCSHTSWTNGICSDCGEECSHTWDNGTCINCGMVCTHTWENGTCTNCGMVCTHTWNDGVCSVCGMICTHSTIEDGVCKVCGKYLYAIDGTLGGKTEATEEDVTALMEQLKSYVDNGITTIVVTGSNPALIEVGSFIMPAVSEALYRLTNENPTSTYCGAIDLILPDVTEILDDEFNNSYAIKSITLPNVTTVGDSAFYATRFLQTITFGSVVTTIKQEKAVVFYFVGHDVGGCNLILNCGQLQTNDTYKPDLENNVWFKPSWGGDVTWKSITLTHTGECDECKANQ